MSLMKWLWMVLVMVAAPVWAASTMTVDADQFEVDRAANTAVFTGNVVVVRTDMTLRCDRLEGEFGTKAAGKLVATGHVVITRTGASGSEQATGARADYNPKTAMLVMTGGVTLTQGGHTLVGERLDYDMKAGKARLTSANRVRATVTEDEK